MKIIQGLDYFPNYLSEEKIDILRQDINFALINAPLFRPAMPKVRLFCTVQWVLVLERPEKN